GTPSSAARESVNRPRNASSVARATALREPRMTVGSGLGLGRALRSPLRKLEHVGEVDRLPVLVPPTFVAVVTGVEGHGVPVLHGEVDVDHVAGTALRTLERRHQISLAPPSLGARNLPKRYLFAWRANMIQLGGLAYEGNPSGWRTSTLSGRRLPMYRERKRPSSRQ